MQLMSSPWHRSLLLTATLLLAVAAPVPAQQQVPAPATVWGFEPGADRKLADYGQVLEYFQILDEASPRVRVEEIGRSVKGRPLVVAFISSEANIAQLDRWREIARRLARARDVDEEEARRLAAEGRAIVWIDGGLHSSEVAHSQHTSVLAHAVATSESPEMRRVRDGVILLLMPVMNPDGLDIVVDWYRGNVGGEYETAPLPWLYHQYVGHDNNRDWFMITQPETEAVSRVLYDEWYPQIVYNHHQVAPFPGRIWVPPFADPVNPHIPPQVVRSVNFVGEAMATRFGREGKPGVVSRMRFTMWWNGGMRTAPYFHNMVGILTETALHRYATPRCYEAKDLPAEFGRGRDRISTREPSVFYPDPWQGGCWHIADAMDYMMTASMAVLDIGARLREKWLHDIFLMGRDAIRRGEEGGPFAYIVPPDQHDAWEAAELVNVLRRGGVEVHRATSEFEADGRRYSESSYIIYTAQAFRPYVMDLLEPQEHPDRALYPGGPPEAPYGNLAGWTLPIQMGVRTDRIERPFQAAAELTDAAVPWAGVPAAGASYGYALSPASNAATLAVNRFLSAGDWLYRSRTSLDVDGTALPPGSIVIVRGPGTPGRVTAAARELGLDFQGLPARPAADLQPLRAPRLALYKSWVANIDEGWTRWVLEEYGFSPDTLFDADIRGGALGGYDVLVLPQQSPERILGGHGPDSMPALYTGGLGETGAVAIARFVREGGTLVALDEASDFVIDHLDLPVRSPLRDLPAETFYVPGSLLRMSVDAAHPVAFGMPRQSAAFFATSRAFEVSDDSADVVARYGGGGDLLLSGWEHGAVDHLADRPAVVQVSVGAGQVVLIGFRSQFRGQARGTLKFLFNPILNAGSADLPATGMRTGSWSNPALVGARTLSAGEWSHDH